MKWVKTYESFLDEKKSPYKDDTLQKYKKEYEEGKEIPFGVRTSLIAQGMIPREGGPQKGKKVKSQEYESFQIEKLKDSKITKAYDRIDSLPKGKLFDDAKGIETIFNRSKRTWNEVIETFEKNESKGKIQSVNVQDVSITQPNIQSNKVKRMIDNHKNLSPINVVQFEDGEMAIYDGHHRLTSTWALGENKIKVNLVKL